MQCQAKPNPGLCSLPGPRESREESPEIPPRHTASPPAPSCWLSGAVTASCSVLQHRGTTASCPRPPEQRSLPFPPAHRWVTQFLLFFNCPLAASEALCCYTSARLPTAEMPLKPPAGAVLCLRVPRGPPVPASHDHGTPGWGSPAQEAANTPRDPPAPRSDSCPDPALLLHKLRAAD